MDNVYNRVDKSTQANPSKALSSHIEIDWDVDFDKKVISGHVVIDVEILEVTSTVDFDTRDLNISSTSIDDETTTFKVEEPHRVLGEKLIIDIPTSKQNVGTKFKVKIVYSASDKATAVQWLEPSATKGGKYPYIFTQGQAIHSRSMLPCQDAPGVKCTYNATVRAPKWCTILMSALSTDKEPVTNGEYHFTQPVPTSAYLIALAGGDLARRDISSRCAVWAEPEVVEDAAWEFAETEQFLSIAEDLTIPYEWGRYDVLCLPPSFPYGGMENPCLTFATPTLLAKDRSLADVIAHEISHSWTGNLVTNATWEHFWLNEGWTVWLERKITSRFKKSQDVFKLSAEMGWKHLKDDVALLECNCKPGKDYTQLVWPLGDEDPDDAFSGVPYEKGFNTLYHLETLIGTPTFEAFAKAYITKFSRKSLTTGEFKDFFESYCKEHLGDKAPTIDWNTLFFSPGMFAPAPDFSNNLSASARELASSWINAAADPTVSMPNKLDISSWSSQQTCVFMEAMLDSAENKPFPEATLKGIEEQYSFSLSKNAEICFRFQKLCLLSDVQWIFNSVFEFVKSQGRMKFVRPLYRLLASSSAQDEARRVFLENANTYHPIARKMLATDLKIAL